MKNFGLASGLILLTFLSGCFNEDIPDPSVQLALDIQKIEKHLQDNNITNFVKDASGVFYVIQQQGPGALPLNQQHVNLTYGVKLLNSTTTLFEQTSIPVFLTVGKINIAGLSVALPKLAEGTKATIYIPSGLAYGTNALTDIPANSNLVFDVEIFDVAVDAAEILAVQEVTIDNYLEDEAITEVLTDPSGLRYVITKEGTGDKPTLANSISVKYKGTLLRDGKKFDESTEPRTFALAGLIEGWQIAFPLLKKGSEATLYIPSGLGYGATGSGVAIPPYAILVFEVELIDVL